MTLAPNGFATVCSTFYPIINPNRTVNMGRNQMPAFGSAMPAQDREVLAAHALDLVK